MTIPQLPLLPLPSLVQAFLTEVTQKHNSKAKVLRKSDSRLMRVIGFFMKPFNPTFMNSYITTIGAAIYVPDNFLEAYSETQILDVITHETQHIIDYTKNRPLFVLGYLFPQIFAPLSILALLGFANPWMFLWLLALLFLAPLPSPGRYVAELHGYRTSILFAKKVYGYNDEQMSQVRQRVVEQLTGSNYYFAWPFSKKIIKDLKDESFMTEPRYQEIIDFLEKHGQLPVVKSIL